MKKAATIWLSAGLISLVLTGVIGDFIFYPHPAEFSFRVLSDYVATAIMLVAACLCWNKITWPS